MPEVYDNYVDVGAKVLSAAIEHSERPDIAIDAMLVAAVHLASEFGVTGADLCEVIKMIEEQRAEIEAEKAAEAREKVIVDRDPGDETD